MRSYVGEGRLCLLSCFREKGLAKSADQDQTATRVVKKQHFEGIKV